MSPAAARATVESLLRDRRLDRTLTAAGPQTTPPLAERLIASGVAGIDAAFDGGVPRGQISELTGPISSGRTALVHRWLAQATAQGELVALVDVLDRFDPVTAAAQGVRLEQLLWVRGEADPTVTRAIKALNLVVSAGGFGLVVFDAGGVPAHALRQLPFTTWLRVQRVLEGSDTACVLLADVPLARSPGGASVRVGGRPRPAAGPVAASFHARVRANRYVGLEPGRPGPAPSSSAAGLWRGAGPRARRFRGLAVTADVQFALRTASCAAEAEA